MSIITFKYKHRNNFSIQLKKAFKIAEFAVGKSGLTTKDVSHFGLNSVISNQVLRKYMSNGKTKKVYSVKLTIPGREVKWKTTNQLWIPCLKATVELHGSTVNRIIKINQIEADNEYFYISCEVQDKPSKKFDRNIGVDRNATGHIAVAAVGSDIYKFGKEATHISRKYKGLRRSAQRKRKYAFLKKISRKESNKIRDINHKISKKIIDLALKNSCNIVLEDLTGIILKKLSGTGNKGKNKKNNKKFLTKTTKQTLSNWSFHQLGTFLGYKSKLSGLSLGFMDPYNSSVTCSRCGALGERNRKSFKCPLCGHVDHADANAAFNIAKAPVMWWL
jgi:putative transposase